MLWRKASADERGSERARARSIYEKVQRELGASFKGQIVAVEPESGEYFVGPTIGEATAAARARHPSRPLHFFRVGFPSVYVWR
jgi:hypothetical protein